MPEPILQTYGLGVRFGERKLLEDVSLKIPANLVYGLIGPSGAGKSTLLSCLNRLIELTPSLRVDGQVLFRGEPVYGPGVNADDLRTRIGVIFQQPAVFPASIYQNAIFGVKHLGLAPKAEWPAVAENVLRQTALWDEVKDRLKQSALKLSVGQQQRLCLARTLAVRPEVILMDEPTSALDPRGTAAIEQLIRELREKHTLVLVTHNLRQAQTVADRLAFLGVRDGAGRLLGEGTPEEVLGRTDVPELMEYLRHH